MFTKTPGRAQRAALILAAAVGLLLSTHLAAAASPGTTPEQALVDKARITLDSFVGDPQMTWLRDNLGKAQGVLVIPDMFRAGFFFGGSGGSGVLLVRDEETGEWRGPAFYILGSVNWGLQIGAQKAEVVMMVMSPAGIRALLSSNFKLGGNVSVALGPMGVGAAGATAPNLSADYLSFSRTRGAYAGLILDGAVVKVNHNANRAYFNEEVTPADILTAGRVTNPQAADLLRAVSQAAR
ncbi:MAG TPA: lipid-binding SYLF domain-containing protein [Desulfobacterales bacterium]|jgi:SH3 domain-containing YSC84-like protein 1|nr:lipid-binding SYLF domain-containing protein [Desulfobacterales bacterium]